MLEDGCEVDSIYLDFAKAFDKVDHFILCKKLRDKRIGGRVGTWLHNFLTNRVSKVSCNGALSKPAPVLSGVPQGTVLGPILFIIMISDLDCKLQRAFASLFADDSRVSSAIKSETDHLLFHHELSNTIYPWAPNNKAVFNGEKFEHIHFAKKTKFDHQYLDPTNRPIEKKKNISKTLASFLPTTSHGPHILIRSLPTAANRWPGYLEHSPRGMPLP